MNLLQKNLDLISRYNPGLKDAILGVSELQNDIGLVETELGEPNLAFNGLALHSQKGAEAEAKAVFAQVKNNPAMMHVVFGFGLGYLFKEFCEHSEGMVILYEPSLEILRATLEVVDFSKELAQGNVFVTCDIENFSHIFKSVFGYKSEVTCSSLPTYRHVYKNDFEALVNQAQISAGVCMIDFNSLRTKTDISVDMVVKNLPYLLEETPLHKYRGAYEGKTALIVSAGPSLDLNIEIIKKNRNKFVVFCVGTALRALVEHGIKPDFLGIIEMNDCSSQVEGIDLSDINLILEPYTNNVFHRLPTKNKFVFATETVGINQAWAKLFGVDISYYKTRGTVSYLALFSAQMLGFKRIVLVGQDLAYVNGRCYSSQSKYAGLICRLNLETNRVEITVDDLESYGRALFPEKIDLTSEQLKFYANAHLEQFNKTLYYVKGVDGSMLPTQASYATFIEHFKEFALDFRGLELINSSMIGAQLDGFKNVALEDVVKNIEEVAETIELPKINSYDEKKIKSKLAEQREILAFILGKIVEGKVFIEKFEREFSRRKMLNEAAIKAFKQLSGLYDEIVLKELPKSLFYAALSLKEDLEVQYELKMHKKAKEQGFVVIFSALKAYFLAVEKKLTAFSL